MHYILIILSLLTFVNMTYQAKTVIEKLCQINKHNLLCDEFKKTKLGLMKQDEYKPAG